MRKQQYAKQYAIGDRSYEVVSEVIDMVNTNCDVAGEPRIPIKFYCEPVGFNKSGWFIECLNKEDESRLEKHLAYIYGLDN